MTFRSAMALVTLLGAMTLTACGGDAVGPGGEVVGGACTLHQECAPGSVCLVDKDYPGGTCSVSCNSDQDCPSGASCVDKDNGVCLQTCLYPQDCRPGYTCKGKDRRGSGGEALVCIND